MVSNPGPSLKNTTGKYSSSTGTVILIIVKLINKLFCCCIQLERDKAFGIFARKQKTEVNAAYTAHSLAADDDVLRRRVKLLLQPGDTLLDTQQWIRVKFLSLSTYLELAAMIS